MKFQCKMRPCAVPIVSIETHTTKGEVLPKPKIRTKVVKFGKTVGWVDRCSRKHFIAVDDEAKNLNKKDYKLMLAECKELNIEVPKGASFALLADSLANLKANKEKKPYKVADKLLVPKESEEIELTNRELKAKLDDAGIKYPPTANKAQLKELLAG